MRKVVLITGASSGIGLATAKFFLNNDYVVCNASRRIADDSDIINYSVDVTNIESIDKAINSIIDKYGRIDILINCAGYSMAAPVQCVLDVDYRYLFDVNLFGAIHTIKTVVPIMKSQGGGRIINISSIGSISPIPYDPYYSASKAALDMLTITLNTELIPYNIIVSSVLPGGTKTDFTFNRKVYNMSNDTSVNNAASALGHIEQNGMSAKSVAKVIYRTAIAKDPPIIVSCGLINKFIYTSVKLLPKKTLINIARKVFKTQ